MKCEIQWIDKDGKATPDNNDAVMMAHIHELKHSLPCGGVGNKSIGYGEQIQASFPICADHYARVTAGMRYGAGGGWEFSNLPTETL